MKAQNSNLENTENFLGKSGESEVTSQDIFTKDVMSLSTVEKVKELLSGNTANVYKDSSHNFRFVNFDLIHGIKPEDWIALVDAIAPCKGERILEGCCGYGDVTKHMLDQTPVENYPTAITMLDGSNEQLMRAQELLKDVGLIDFKHASVTHIPCESNTLDTVVIKMGIHEFPAEDQQKAFGEIYRALKPGGKFVMWDLALYPETREFWNSVIRRKDQLCNFTSLEKNRNFLSHAEIFSLFENAGFQNTQEVHPITPRLNIRDRFTEMISKELVAYPALCEKMRLNINFPLEEIPEYLRNLAEEKIQLLLAHIRSHTNETINTLMNVEDKGDTIIFTQRKGIFVGYKK